MRIESTLITWIIIGIIMIHQLSSRSGGRKLPPTPRNPSALHFGAVGAAVMAATQRPPNTGQHLTGYSRICLFFYRMQQYYFLL